MPHCIRKSSWLRHFSISLLHTIVRLSRLASTTALVACGFIGVLPGARAQADSVLQPYAPQQVAPPKSASYVLPDGSIYVAGNDVVAPIFERLNEIFLKAHPDFKFKMEMLGSSLGVSGVTSGKSAFGPMGRDARRPDYDAFTERYGYELTDVKIGYDNSPDGDKFPPGKTPPAVWVNARNPLVNLTVDQVARILTTGGGAGDITHWGQLGIGGDLSTVAIHVYLPRDYKGLYAYLDFLRDKVGGYPFTRRAEWLPSVEDVMNAVAQDSFSLGLVGFWPPDGGWDRQADFGTKVRIVPLATDEEAKPSRGAPGDLYPFAPGIHIFLNRAPGKPMDPWLKEYVRLALSKEGQEIIGSMRDQGFIPLDPKDVSRELAKLE